MRPSLIVLLLAAGLNIGIGIENQLQGQVVVVRPSDSYGYWSTYNVPGALAGNVRAQAALFRAQLSAARAHARMLNARAGSMELDLWMKNTNDFFDRQILNDEKQLEMQEIRKVKQMAYLNDQRWRNNRQWELLKNHPELSEGAIRSGAAHNFLLDRLAVNQLPYQFVAETSGFDAAELENLTLDPAWFDRIKLKQGAYIFAANQHVREEISFWPYILRWQEFDATRSCYEDARREAVKQSDDEGRVSVAAIQTMRDTFDSFCHAFYCSDAKQRVLANGSYRHYFAAERFLRELKLEIMQLEKTGDIRPLQDRKGYNPEVDGEHLLGLLCYMSRNGIEFAEPTEGSEFAYYNLFKMMRAVYLKYEGQDISRQPENLVEVVHAKTEI